MSLNLIRSTEATNANVTYPVYNFTSMQQTASTSSPKPIMNFVIEVGDSGYWFRIAANKGVASNRYVIQSSYIADPLRTESWGQTMTPSS